MLLGYKKGDIYIRDYIYYVYNPVNIPPIIPSIKKINRAKDMAQTNTKIPWTWVGIAGILITIIICLLTCKKGSNTSFVPIYHDTVWKTVYVYDTITKYDYIERPNVTGYIKQPHVDSFTTFEVVHDTITQEKQILVKIHDTTIQRLSSAFLIQYPDNPKLLRGILTEDSLNMDLFFPTGRIFTQSYPINTFQNDYVWENGEMKVIKKPFKLKNIKGTSFFYTLYDPLQRQFRLQADYSLTYKNISLYALGSFQPNARPVFGTFIGSRVRLK